MGVGKERGENRGVMPSLLIEIWSNILNSPFSQNLYLLAPSSWKAKLNSLFSLSPLR